MYHVDEFKGIVHHWVPCLQEAEGAAKASSRGTVVIEGVERQ